MRNIHSKVGKMGLLGKAAVGTVVMAGAILGGAAPKAEATPSTLGFYPSTDVYGKNNFHLDVDTYGQGVRTDFPTVGLTYGIGPDTSGFFGRSEIGADYFLTQAQTSGGNAARLFGNAKTQIFDNPTSGTRAVVGVWGLGSKRIFAPSVGYILGSKTFDFGRVHLGIAHAFADRDTVSTPNGHSSRTNLQLGYDRYFAGNKLQFAVDFYSGKSSYSGIQPTLYYYINPQANFGIGLFRLNDSSVQPRNQVYLCFDYNFGKGAPKDPAPEAPTPETAPAAPATN